MTSSTPIKAARDGMITSETGPVDPVAHLRGEEAKGLIGLASDALHAACNLTHDIHAHVYKPDGNSAAESQRKLLATLTCMETAEHYLRMLDEVLADVPGSDGPRDADTGGPWEQ
jgi:hypothetical protein